MKKMTLGIFAHANAGKTTLTEHLLYHTKVISSIGRVDSGTTVTDSMSIEKKRGITIRSSVVSFDLEAVTVQLIDTPGHIDFYAEVERALNTLDGAVLVISGVESVEAQTYSIWHQLTTKKIPTIIFINKMDRKGADYQRVLNDLRLKLNANIVPFTNVVVQDDCITIERTAKEILLDSLLDYESDLIVNKIDDLSSITYNDILSELFRMSKAGQISLVVGGSSLKDIGVSDVLSCINECIPTYNPVTDGLFCGYVFASRFYDGRKRAFVKIISGSLSIKDSIYIDEDTEIKVSSMLIPVGSRLINADSVVAGDIVVLENMPLFSGQVIGFLPLSTHFNSELHPLIDMQIQSESGNGSAVVQALNILNEEDPYLNVRFSTDTMKICVSLMGDVQGQVLEQMVLERFGLKITLQNPTLIHRETPTQISTGKAYYTRVSGIEIQVKPLTRGSGLVIKSSVSTDILHKKYQRQAERLIKQYVKQGVYGWEVTDAEISIINGKFDSLGSKPRHFNIAVPLALMRALKNSMPMVLEPVSEYNVVFPSLYSSSIMQFIGSLNGTYSFVKNKNDSISIMGEAATRNLVNAPLAIARLTSGRGIFISKVSKYQNSYDQTIKNEYYGPDPRNEVTFVVNDMNAGLDSLDPIMSKKKKVSKSKYKRVQHEKEIFSMKAKGEL